jgi:hypothetical protein
MITNDDFKISCVADIKKKFPNAHIIEMNIDSDLSQCSLNAAMSLMDDFGHRKCRDNERTLYYSGKEGVDKLDCFGMKVEKPDWLPGGAWLIVHGNDVVFNRGSE